MRYWLGLLFFVAANAFAAWVEGETDDGDIYAATTNDDGQVLAQYCALADASCTWLMVTQDTCDVGKTRTPALVSGPAGSAATSMACLSNSASNGKTYYRLGFYPFDSVDTLFRQTGTVGIAFPLESGQFRVVRFNLNGGVGVIDRMREKALKKVKSSTKGQTL